MPDILTRGAEILKELESKPHTVHADNYYCPKVGYVWHLQEIYCPHCGAQVTHLEYDKENGLPSSKNALERDSAQSSPIPADSATPETITISLPALRAVLMATLDDGDPIRRIAGLSRCEPWALNHVFPDVANDCRMRFADELEKRLRQLPARG